MDRIVKCPRCRKSVKYSPDNPYRPFCSERCKLIDLGQWAEEKYAIPVTDPEIDEASGINDTDQDDESKQKAKSSSSSNLFD